MSQSLAHQVRHYLHEVLGTNPPEPKPWGGAHELPYYLQDAFQWHEIDLLGQRVVLALETGDAKAKLRDVRSKLAKARGATNQPIVYVTSALASYERRQLIEHKTSFLVPGNQLYIPDLGIDLREYFRQRISAPDALGPATQAVLVTMLLQTEQAAWRAGELARALDYSPMTLSRVIRELEHAELVTTRGQGRSRQITLADGPAVIWERAMPVLRSPVKKVEWSSSHPMPAALHHAPLAGASALAHHTMLAEPTSTVRAASPAQWKAATEAGLDLMREEQSRAIMWQVWSYKPPRYRAACCVDPLSLTLSLRDEQDERVQIALEELKETFPW
ncbi:MAG: hypothetical protein JWM80_2796 [Cyanobacteria bacterium RYN_339]|nr:hypothetical protein [Cyanobacteria bacterium RYN_339]